MPRPLRLDQAGAWFHVTARGNERQPIFLDDADRLKLLSLLARARARFDTVCHAYCLMGNHYHLVLESVSGRLSRAMQYVNGSFARYFNERRSRVGHLFQGRFNASLIERDTYLLARQAKRARSESYRRRVRSDQMNVDRPALSQVFHGRKDRRHRRLAGIEACVVHGYTMSKVADYLDVHYTTVSRWVKTAECDNS